MNKTIYTTNIQSPLGEINLAATEKGLCLLEFDNKERIQKHFNQLKKYWGIKLQNKNSDILKETEKQLGAYFNKTLTKFDLPIDLAGSDFQISVWKELINIPYGTTRTYKEQAIAVGDLKAIRAVATANGQNRISIIIPCHRVIGSDGSLTGYGGELWRKQKLLGLESNQTILF